MELTVDQALQNGVAAHKEGKLQDAERLYRAILLITIPELTGQILSHVRYLMKNKAEGPAGYGRTESQAGRD